MKYTDFKRYKLYSFYKNINFRRYNFLNISKYIDLTRVKLKKILKLGDISKKFDYKKLYNITKINLPDFRKYVKYIKFNFLVKYFLSLTVFVTFLYLSIPSFYNYDQSKIESYICKNKSIECIIKGKINYSFIPSPRIKIKNITINDKKENILVAENFIIKLSIKNLLNKKKQNYKKIKVENFKIILNLKNYKKYQNLFKKEFNFIPIDFLKGDIIFVDDKNYIATIRNVNSKVEVNKKISVKGNFLNDDISFTLNKKKVEKKFFTKIKLTMKKLNFLSEVTYYNSENNENIVNSNFLVKKGKNKLTGIFDYKNNKIIINKSNLRNPILDGRLIGEVVFLPYFDFNLELALNSINFTSLYNYFLGLGEERQKSLFKINKKVNGKLILSSNKVYSRHNLVKSFESQIKFRNGNISVDQFIINLGKLGAADLVGEVNNEKKITNFKYESNIFVENDKKFLSKFSIYKKRNVASNYFISGNFDLENIKNTFYEISFSDNKKLSETDVSFVESEFNELVLMEGYKNLFYLPKFKEFLKSITMK